MRSNGVALRVSQLRKKQLIALLGAIIRSIRDEDFCSTYGAGQFVVQIPFEHYAKGLHRHFQTLVDFPVPELGKDDRSVVVIAVTGDGVAVRRRKGERGE